MELNLPMNDCFLPGYISSLALFIGSVRVLETSLISDTDGLQMGLAILDLAIYIVDNQGQCFLIADGVLMDLAYLIWPRQKD